MKQAIVTGATGYVGSAVVRELLQNDVQVLAVGRKRAHTIDQPKAPSERSYTYVPLDLSRISRLPEITRTLGWNVDSACVFYNFAWSGLNSLTDGSIEDQLKNATYLADTISTAKTLGCKRVVNAGSMDETYMNAFLQKHWLDTSFKSGHDFYALSKLAARDLCRLTAYLQKIEYIHTRFSVFVDESLSGSGYIATTLLKIARQQDHNPPLNDQLFDILSTQDGARAYRLIGLHGKSRSDYFIGSGQPSTLESYFARFRDLAGAGRRSRSDSHPPREALLNGHENFSIARLTEDTGFTPSLSFDDFCTRVLRK